MNSTRKGEEKREELRLTGGPRASKMASLRESCQLGFAAKVRTYDFLEHVRENNFKLMRHLWHFASRIGRQVERVQSPNTYAFGDGTSLCLCRTIRTNIGDDVKTKPEKVGRVLCGVF